MLRTLFCASCAALLCLAAAASAGTAAADRDTRPNIVFILADDLGYGDLSSFGATDINTPNIDRLAAEGMRMTHHYTPANTCSPTRAALLTGRYPPRTGVNAVLGHDTVEGLPLEEITLAEILRDAGYATAMIGKWHLGQVEAFMPWRQGFDYFFGAATSNDDGNFYLYESRGVDYRRLASPVDQTQLSQQYTQQALQFLEAQREATEPFFLYFAHSLAHIPLHPNPRFVGSSERGIYGDVVQELDDSVGQVLEKLAALSLDKNTLVVFTSDNGAWRTMREFGGSNGILREGKLTAFDGGHRVPALVRWPQRIPAGQVNEQLATMMDWFVTLAQYGGADVPHDRIIDGKPLQSVLEGTGRREEAPFFYFALRAPHEEQAHRLAAVRDGKWKLKAPQQGYYPHLLEPLMRVGLYRHGELLFDLESDPGETRNVIEQHPEVAGRLRQLMADFEAGNPMPPPVRTAALARDAGGWEKMWYGIAAAAVIVLLLVAIAMKLLWLLGKRLLKRQVR
jgi:arylsulfatase A-like enzyme